MTTSPKPSELQAWLRDRLPEYMIPAAFVMLEAFPLTPNRKIDRKRLPEPTPVERADYTAPQTPGERELANIWAEVLELEKVGRDDDFFALGGHSLMATRVIARIRERMGLELSLRSIFATPVLRDLAASLELVGQSRFDACSRAG